MNSLSQFLVDSILKEETLGTVALFGGGFKPPTKGHLEVVLQGLKENPEVSQVYILVGSGERNGVTQSEAVKIWKMYQQFIPVASQIIPVQSPFSYIKTYLQDHKDEKVYIFIGARPDNEEDDKDVAERSAFAKKYSENAMPVRVQTTGGVSGTMARKAALSGNQKEFITYFPSELTDLEKQEIIDMISGVVKEQLNENATYSKHIDLLPLLAKLTNHMINKGYKIEPLPGLKLIDGDIENAKDFFGKTAYYDPNEKMIVLYTEGRHPKDIARSYAHEMIHHQQNLEGRLGNITTTDTTEDSNLEDIEKEAYLNGNISFRNWTDSLQEKKKVKDPFGLNAYARELAKGLEEAIINEGMYDSIVTKLAKDVTNAWVSQFKEDPKRLFALLDTNYEMEDKKGRPLEFDLLAKLDFKKTKDRTYKVDGGANEGDDESEGFVALSFQVDPRELPRMWSTIAMDIRDVLRHEIEHLTQGGWNVRQGKEMADDSLIRDLINKYKTLAPKNYFMLDKEVDAMLQGMYFKAKKSRRPFIDIIEDYLDKVGLDPEEKEEIKTRWRGRLKALSLPVFETETGEMPKETADLFTIYLDMDGVIVDFDKRFESLFGMPPREFENNFGKDKFWEKVDAKGVGFWRGMDWMPGGQKLYNRVAQHKHALLSSPSRSSTSKIGKHMWKRDNTPNTKLILAQSFNKKNYADKSNILIDDRADNIQQWKDAGGIGILYQSAEQVMKELDKLGL